MKKKLFFLMLVLMPMSMMAQTIYHSIEKDGLLYLYQDGDDPNDDSKLFIIVDGSLTADGVQYANTDFVPDGSVRSAWRYKQDQNGNWNTGTCIYKADNVTPLGTARWYKSDMDAITTFKGNWGNNGPTSFQGIEYFRNITSLTVKQNTGNGVDLDLSKNTKLTTLAFTTPNYARVKSLNISNTQLTSLSLPEGSKSYLATLILSNTHLNYTESAPLDAQGFTLLNRFNVDVENSGLEIGKQVIVNDVDPNITILTIPDALGKDVELSAYTQLQKLTITNVGELDLSQNSTLQELTVTGGTNTSIILPETPTNLTKIDVSKSSVSGTFDVSSCSALTTLYTQESKITKLDAHGLTNLILLRLFPAKSYNDDIPTAYDSYDYRQYVLDTLDVSGCSSLGRLYVTANSDKVKDMFCNVRVINASNCTSMTDFYCYQSLLDSLDLSGCTELKTIAMHHGLLKTVNLSGCNKIDAFRAHRQSWENMDFLLKPQGDRTAAGIGNLRNIQLNGGSYIIKGSDGLNYYNDGKSYVRLIRTENGETRDLHYTTRIKELNLDYCSEDTLRQLMVANNMLQKLDLSKAGKNITYLQCENNRLLTLDLSMLPFNRTVSDPQKPGQTLSFNLGSKWNRQVEYIDVEVVKSMDTAGNWDGVHDWVAIHLPNGGYTHKLDNNLMLLPNLYYALHPEDIETDNVQIATEANPWLATVQETADLDDFAGQYLCPTGHEGEHLFLHSQQEIASDFGAYKDQDLYGKLLTYKYNTGFNQELDANGVPIKNPDGSIKKVNTSISIDPHITIRAHIWPYIINLNPATKNNSAKKVDYYSSTLYLDYDALIPEGVTAYFISGVANKDSVMAVGKSTVDAQLKMDPFGGDGTDNRILPAYTPVYIRSTLAPGLYNFLPIWDFDIKGWSQDRAAESEEDAILHGVEPTEKRIIQPQYVDELEAAKTKKASMTNILTGIKGTKSSSKDMEAKEFNRYPDGKGGFTLAPDTSFAVKRQVLILTFENQKGTKVLGFWPYNGTKVPAHRCVITAADFFAACGTTNAKGGSFYFDDEDETTGIKTIDYEPAMTDDSWYTLQGVRLNSRPTKQGIYIHGGKKIIIK